MTKPRSLLLVLGLVTSLAWLGLARSAEAPEPAQEEAPDVALPRAPVVLDGVTLFWVRGSSTVSPETRAAAIEERLRRVAKDPTQSTADLKIVETDGVVGAFAGDLRLFAVLESDARAEGITVRELAQLDLMRVQGAISSFRANRTPDAMIRAAGFAAVATILLIGAL